jgi:transposase InsO family protein
MHERLGHASSERLRLLGISHTGKCRECVLGKQTRKSFPPNRNPRVKHKLERVYSDLCPVTPDSFGHGKYFIVFVDELTRYVWAYVIPNKTSSTILQILKSWTAMVKNQSGRTVINLRTDEGREYMGETLKTVSTFLTDNGITHEQTSAYSSSSNGVAERMNRTLMDMVRPMLIKSKLPTPFWAEALYTAVKIRNRLPTSSLKDHISPHEAWFGTPPTLDHLRQFGCLALPKIPHPKTKAGARSNECCFLGYDGNTQYRLYDPTTNKVLTRVRDVTFFENEFLDPSVFSKVPYADRPLQVPEPRNYDEIDEEFDPDDLPVLDPVIPMPAYLPGPLTEVTAPSAARDQPRWPIPSPPRPPSSSSESSQTPDESVTGSRQVSPYVSPHDSPQTSPRASAPPSPRVSPPPMPAPIDPPRVDPVNEPRRSGRDTRPSKKAAEAAAGAKRISTSPTFALSMSSSSYTPSYAPPEEPQSVEQALTSPYAMQWTTAMLEELASLDKHGTYEIVPRPKHQKVVGSKFAFKIKDPETSNPRFKARLVAKGYTQVPGTDFEDTFAPVVKATSVRALASHAAGNGLLLNQYDVETAFLNPDIDRDIYIEQPPSFNDPNYPRDQYVLKALKGLYGLRQAGYLFSNDTKQKMLDLGFTPSDADECVYISADSGIIVATYVDDGLVCAQTQQEIDWVLSELSKFYTIRNLGPPTKFLGLDIVRPHPRGPITISQSTYARKLLAKFNMDKCNPAKAPCDSKASHLHLRTNSESSADGSFYRSITSSIMHLAIWTRPDIAWITNKLCQFNHDPSELHMAAVKHLMRYIQGTLDYSFTYSPSQSNSLYGLFVDYNNSELDITPLHGYSDASNASDPDDRCSTSGYIFFYNNGPVSWASRKQSYAVALSTMESEYLALTETAKEAKFLRRLLLSMNVPQDAPTLILTDSDSALKHVKNNVNHPRSKHIDTRHHYIRFAYNSGDVDIRYIPSASQTADILTKPLGTLKHADAVKLLQLQDSRFI